MRHLGPQPDLDEFEPVEDPHAQAPVEPPDLLDVGEGRARDEFAAPVLYGAARDALVFGEHLPERVDVRGQAVVADGAQQRESAVMVLTVQAAFDQPCELLLVCEVRFCVRHFDHFPRTRKPTLDGLGPTAGSVFM